MELKLNTGCVLPKKMSTERPGKAGESEDLVICTLNVGGVRVQRDQADELAGVPVGATSMLYDELGAPFQHLSFIVPKRGLFLTGRIEHRRDSGAATAALEMKKAICTNLKFVLDVPDDQGPTVLFSFKLTWKTRGDEADDLKHLLRDHCFMIGKFEDEAQRPLLQSSPASPKAEAAAGHRAKLDRKRQAAGEKETDDDPIPPIEEVTVTVSGPGKKKKTTSLAELKREAEAIAKKHPRKDPPKKQDSKRGKR